MKFVFLDADTVSHKGDVSLEALRNLGKWEEFGTTLASETAARVQGVDVVISNKVVLSRRTLEGADQIKLIAVTATGTNNVDLDAAKELGIQVCNVSGYSTDSVAQHAIAMMLNLTTSMPRYLSEKQAWAKSPIFTRLDYPVRDMGAMTLGIVGAGNIGVRVGEIASSFGMKVQCLQRGSSSSVNHAEWPRLTKDEFFKTSDIVSLHCPLTPDTHHLIDAKTLALMPSSAFLVNTGRGELIDETALIDALRGERLAGAGLDVLAQEPPPADHSLLIFDHPGLLITPHNAWSSQRTRQGLVERVASNIQKFIDSGEAGNRVA